MQMTRKTKISCDITRDADNMLKIYCNKHQRSKGFLIDKMIRKFCVDGEAEATKPSAPRTAAKPKPKPFVKPSELDVSNYMSELGIVDLSEAQKFCDFYESKGWLVGKVKMKCWKSAIRNWIKSLKEKSYGKNNLGQSKETNNINNIGNMSYKSGSL